MVGQIFHVGLTVSDLDRSVAFYTDVLGLKFQGELLMEGSETEAMFQKPGCRARVAYLSGTDDLRMPPVELIQFVGTETEKRPSDLFTTSISELCFYTHDADEVYADLCARGVECLSAPQDFDFTKNGFGRSRAFYFKDPDGMILEVMQTLID